MKTYNITVNGVTYTVEVEEVGATASAPVAAAPVAAAPVAAPAAPKAAPTAPKASGAAGAVIVKAPMPGNIMKVNCKVGASVKKGDILLILEAMKMENEILAPCDGTVKQIVAAKGASVNSGDALIVIG